MPPKRAASAQNAPQVGRTLHLSQSDSEGEEEEDANVEMEDEQGEPEQGPGRAGRRAAGANLQGNGATTTKKKVSMSKPPSGKKRRSATIAKTAFAGSYRSRLTELGARHAPSMLPLLAHVNCSLLSGALIPTLEDLKQHAQGLALLIRHISLSTSAGFIDNANITIPDAHGNRVVVPAFSKGEAFDWLNDLQHVYANAEPHHRLPLTGVANCLHVTDLALLDGDVDKLPHQSLDRRYKESEKCPLLAQGVSQSEPGMPGLPWATHQNLIRHANEVLELLDHEYSAKGGLLAILPPEDQKEQRALAETTLLGQMIVWIQSLVLRIHTLERQYANATDILEGESTVPHQMLDRLGPTGRQSRPLTYPQDRFVLANCGEDVWNFLNDELQKKATAEENRRAEERFHGVANQDANEHYNSLVCVDVCTRYYRLLNQPEKTIFVCPAWESHPGVKVTRELEKTPSVVAVVKPVFPERASEWQARNNELLHQAKLDKQEVERSREQIDNYKDQVAVLAEQNKLIEAKNHHLLMSLERFTRGENNNEDYYVYQQAQIDIRAESLEKQELEIKGELELLDSQRRKLASERKSIDDERAAIRQRGEEANQAHAETLRRLELAARQKQVQQDKDYNDKYNEMVAEMAEGLANVEPLVAEIKKFKDSQPWTEEQARDFCDRVYEIAQDAATGKFTVVPRATRRLAGEGVELRGESPQVQFRPQVRTAYHYGYSDEDDMDVDDC